MRLAVWSPLPPSPSGVADYVAETLPELARRVHVEAVVPNPEAVDPGIAALVRLRRAGEPVDADIDLYHIGNSPAHAYVYRAALRRPGVAVLHDWSLHHLVLHETVERGDRSAYLREMRRAHGERGTFVGRQVARALGGPLLPALFPLNDRLLERSLGIVGLTEYVRSGAAQRLPGRPVLHLPHHVSLPLAPLPSREEARRFLGLPQEAILLAAPGLATAAKRLHVAVRVVAGLSTAHPNLRFIVAGGVDPALPLETWAREAGLGSTLTITGRLSLDDFIRHLAAADIILALRFPSHGEISGALLRALGVGRPTLVTAGTPAAEEFPEGIVIPVDPGPHEEAELSALLDHLIRTPALRETVGRLAREHVRREHDLSSTVDCLVLFVRRVLEEKPAILDALAKDEAAEGTLLGFLLEEVRAAARDLGVPGLRLGLAPLLSEITGGRGGR